MAEDLIPVNRKQKCSFRRRINHQNYLANRSHWCSVGPPIVMELPTEAHVKDLLMEWLVPKVIKEDAIKEILGEANTRGLIDQFYNFMENLAGRPDILSHNNPSSDLLDAVASLKFTLRDYEQMEPENH